MSIKRRIEAEVNSLNRLNPNITIFIVYGLLYDVFLNIYKPFAVKFLERLGGTDFHIALYNALPGLCAALMLLPGSIMIGRRRSKKKITAVFFLLSRIFILIIAFVPFFPMRYQPLLFVVFIAVMNLPEAVAQTSLQSFLGTIFDGRVRATAITLRNKFGNIAIPLVTLITGLIIGLLPKNDAERIVYYQIFYVTAFIVSVLEIRTFISFREMPDDRSPADDSPQAGDPPPVGLKTVAGIIREPKFIRFLLTTLIFQFVWQAGWPLSTIYQIKTLHANELWLAAFAVASGVCSFLSAGFWNRLIYKRGNDLALAMAAFAMAVNMFAIGLSPNLPVMLIASIYNGFAVIGINCTLLNGLLGATPNDNRIIAIAVYNTFVNLSLFISPFVANALLESTGIVNAMMIVGVGRVAAAVILWVDWLYLKKKPEK